MDGSVCEVLVKNGGLEVGRLMQAWYLAKDPTHRSTCSFDDDGWQDGTQKNTEPLAASRSKSSQIKANVATNLALD